MVRRPDVHLLHWRKATRLVPTQIPRIALYERLAETARQRDLIALEQMTNPRVQAELNRFHPLRDMDHFRANASVYVKAPFAHLSQSRFGNGRFPILYAASNEGTALAEKKYHDILFWRAHGTPALSVKRRMLILDIRGHFHDLRRLRTPYKNLYAPDSYTASQTFGAELWISGSEGIAYDSVRRSKGQCLAVFSPQTITSCALGPLYEFHWDGQSITGTFRLSDLS